MNTAEEILAHHHEGCSCDEAYTSRGLTAPDCAWCNNVDGILEAMKEYAKNCLNLAAERVELKAPRFRQIGGIRWYEATKETITDEANII